jgi:hypothetical protein
MDYREIMQGQGPSRSFSCFLSKFNELYKTLATPATSALMLVNLSFSSLSLNFLLCAPSDIHISPHVSEGCTGAEISEARISDKTNFFPLDLLLLKGLLSLAKVQVYLSW